jgi:glycosyltransferase involved in cell wall biosynthesis
MKIRLIVAGEFYEDKSFYDKKIEDLNLQETVEFRSDFIPDNEVKYYFGIADMVVQPYRSATQSGVSQIAYHFDKPMLVTDVGGLAEIIPNGKVGYVVDVNPAKIADGIVDFYENNRSEEFISNIKEEKKKYRWAGMVETILEL